MTDDLFDESTDSILPMASGEVHPIFRTPELVALIMIELHGEVDCDDYEDCSALRNLASCMRVCKQWTNIVLGELWPRHANLDRYFTLLDPLEVDADGFMTFTRMLDPKSFDRWMFYSSSVTHLRLKRCPVHLSTISEIVLLSGTKDLFPSLESLIIGADWLSKSNNEASHLLHLVPSTLQKLELSFLVNPDAHFLIRFLSMVANKAPGLKELHLDSCTSRAPNADEALLQSMVQSFRQFKFLEEVSVPSAWINLEFLQMLSKLSQLKVINEECDNGEFQIALDDLKTTKPEVYNSLVNATLSGSLPLVRRLLLTLFSLCSLTTFDMFVSVYDSSTTEQGLLDCLSDASKTFRELQSVGIYYVRQHPTTPVERLTKACLEPLSQLVNLRDFEVRHPEHLLISEDDAEEITRWWPKMERLCLNSCTAALRGASVATLEPSRLSLGVVEKILSHLPRLRFLSLEVNCRTDHLSQSSKLYYQCKFIHLGFSFVDVLSTNLNVARAAIYLSSVLWENCTLSYQDLDPDPPETELTEGWADFRSARKNAAEELLKAVRLSTEVRQAEQELQRLRIAGN